MSMAVDTLWLRAESKPFEQRCALVPEDAESLSKAGFPVVVEDSPQSCYPAEEYRRVGCAIVAAGAWRDAPKTALIVGLKELPDEKTALKHCHVFFGHAYKKQIGAGRLLARFAEGGGELWDWEYLRDSRKHRLVAFGYWAGFAGALVALKIWLWQQECDELNFVPGNRAHALESLRYRLEALRPEVMIMGASGRCGRGAGDCFAALGVPVTGWGRAETAEVSGPYPDILRYDIFLNAVLIGPQTGIFLDQALIENTLERRLSVIVDVSCDPTSPYNPLPIYQATNSFAHPIHTLGTASHRLDLSAIDHLPTLLPKESSRDFSHQALEHLLQLRQTGSDAEPWRSCRAAFVQAQQEGKAS